MNYCNVKISYLSVGLGLKYASDHQNFDLIVFVTVFVRIENYGLSQAPII